MKLIDNLRDFGKETWRFFTDDQHGRSRQFLFFLFWISYVGVLLYEHYQPDFYVESSSKRLAPVFLWLGPVLVLGGFFFAIKASQKDDERK